MIRSGAAQAQFDETLCFTSISRVGLEATNTIKLKLVRLSLRDSSCDYACFFVAAEHGK